MPKDILLNWAIIQGAVPIDSLTSVYFPQQFISLEMANRTMQITPVCCCCCAF